MNKSSEKTEKNDKISKRKSSSRHSKSHKRRTRDDIKKSSIDEKTEAAKAKAKIIIDSVQETANVPTSISDQSIIGVMGKKNYGIVLNALCSLTDMSVKSQAICALLTNTKTYNNVHTQTTSDVTSIGSQTENSSLCFGNDSQTFVSPSSKCIGKNINSSRDLNSTFDHYKGVAASEKQTISSKSIHETQNSNSMSSLAFKSMNYWNNSGNKSKLYGSEFHNKGQTSSMDSRFVNGKKMFLPGKSTSSEPFNIFELDQEELPNDMTETISICDSISTNLVIDGVTEMNKMIGLQSPSRSLAGKEAVDLRMWNCSTKIDSFTVNSMVESTVPDSTISFMEKVVNVSSDFTQTVIQNIIHDRDRCLDADDSGYLPIHHAVMDNDLKRVRFLHTILKMRSTRIDCATTDDSFTSLHVAVIHNSSQAMITLLLELGCSVLTRDNQDRNVFHHCAMQQDSCPLQTVLNWLCGVKVQDELTANMGILLTALTDTDISGNTPPMQCVLSLKSEHLMIMLQELDPKDAEVVVNFRNANNGMTALFLTTQCDIDGCGISRLSMETKNCIKLLCDKKADWSIECFRGTNAMQFAQDCNNTDFMMYASTFTGEKRRMRQGTSGPNINFKFNRKCMRKVFKRNADPSEHSEKRIMPRKRIKKHFNLLNSSASFSGNTSPSSNLKMGDQHWTEGVFKNKPETNSCATSAIHHDIKIEPMSLTEESNISQFTTESQTIHTTPPKDLSQRDNASICIEKMTVMKAPDFSVKPVSKQKFTVPPIDLTKLPGRHIPSILLKNGMNGLKRLKVVDCNNIKTIPINVDKKVSFTNIKNDSIGNFRVVTKIDKNKSVRVIATDHVKRYITPDKPPVEVLPLQLKAFKIFKPASTDNLFKFTYPVSNSVIKNVSLLKSPDAKLSLLKSTTEEKTTDSKDSGQPQE